jgi:hypothetical protein
MRDGVAPRLAGGAGSKVVADEVRDDAAEDRGFGADLEPFAGGGVPVGGGVRCRQREFAFYEFTDAQSNVNDAFDGIFAKVPWGKHYH